MSILFLFSSLQLLLLHSHLLERFRELQGSSVAKGRDACQDTELLVKVTECDKMN